MPQWAIAGQFTDAAATPDEAIARLQAGLARRLRPGEGGSPWQVYGKGEPSFVVSSVREVRPDPGVPRRRGRRGVMTGSDGARDPC